MKNALLFQVFDPKVDNMGIFLVEKCISYAIILHINDAKSHVGKGVCHWEGPI